VEAISGTNEFKPMISKRQHRLAAEKLLKKPEDKFEPVDLSTAKNIPPGMTRSWRNNRYTVMVYDDSPTTHGPAIVVMIQNHMDAPIVGHWATLQRIKSELFGNETTAVEYYPAESALHNYYNIYWLVIYPDGVLPKLIL
jgi:hypothetical protein